MFLFSFLQFQIHNMRYNEYEAKYGDCEILTEFFFCAICNSECKHMLKNIHLHLKNVHKMSLDQYEEQYGMIPEDWIVGEDDVKTEWNIGTGVQIEIENVTEKIDENSDGDDIETSSTVSQRARSFIK